MILLILAKKTEIQSAIQLILTKIEIQHIEGVMYNFQIIHSNQNIFLQPLSINSERQTRQVKLNCQLIFN